MAENNRKNASLIQRDTSAFNKIVNSIDITNRIIKEREERIAVENLRLVKIGKQEWMSKNLEVDCYSNGDPIPQVQNPEEWQRLKTGAWCYYNNDASNGEKYGKLYNWYAINDKRGLAPTGYHIPSVEEFKVLLDTIGTSAGAKMKSSDGWAENGNGTNESGLSSFPGGIFLSVGFKYVGENCYMWSSTQKDEGNAYYLGLNNKDEFVVRIFQYKECGMSIRCLRD
jgi:uncharacterized protein (TIGR02145 family)